MRLFLHEWENSYAPNVQQFTTQQQNTGNNTSALALVLLILTLEGNIQISKEMVGNFWDILIFIRHFRPQISSESSKRGHTKRINPKFATESAF